MPINVDPTGVITGALVNALAVTGRRLSVAARDLRRRDPSGASLARWLDTGLLTDRLPEIPGFTEDQAEQLHGDEIQAALQALLAARLTDAPETDAARARELLNLAIGSPFAAALTDYYDDQIAALVAALEARDPPMLSQIRSDAFSTRLVAALDTIERNTAALRTRPGRRAEADFLASYRRHVTAHHGKIEPPDFDRRRRVALHDIYVPTVIQPMESQRTHVPAHGRSGVTVWELARWLDRTVLLGDPGGGKTTAANVLMHHFASGLGGPVPFLVTLRDYAARFPPERSIAGHIEHTLETFYQSPPPPGMVDLLLLTGRAVVIFDGLDELLDTARRADVSDRVEHFCLEYPQAQVLVTSRVTGYDQARLDESQFTCYRLCGLLEDQVAEFARKWFALEDGAPPDDADAFLRESDSIPDLRSNPLMLTLLCILYRGEGSLPRNRCEIYQECTRLLLSRWDARRHIHSNLRAGHLLEPTLRHLAWWLFSLDDTKTAVTERELIAQTTKFLHGRGFESEEKGRKAATEFVEFCRGRAWVFTDTGTTASGEKVYAFTHRTFLEYFTASNLAFRYDTPKQLAQDVSIRIARPGWIAVCELAIQIKDRTSEDGAQRIYTAVRTLEGAGPTSLKFLCLCLRSVDPSPDQVRALVRQILSGTLGSANAELPKWSSVVDDLLGYCGGYRDVVAAELERCLDEVLQGSAATATFRASWLAASLSTGSLGKGTFWRERGGLLIRRNTAAVAAAAPRDNMVRTTGLEHGAITLTEALEMPGGLAALCQPPNRRALAGGHAYLAPLLDAFLSNRPSTVATLFSDDLRSIGQYLRCHREPPWFTSETVVPPGTPARPHGPVAAPSPDTYLGAAVIVCMLAELGQAAPADDMMESLRDALRADTVGSFRDLPPYLELRWSHSPAPHGGHQPAVTLRDLPLPGEFRQLVRHWAEHRVNFVSGPLLQG